MTMVLVLLSSACWAALDALRKMFAGRVAHKELVLLITLGQAFAFLLSAFGEDWSVLGSQYIYFGLISIILNSVAVFLFMRSVELSPLSQSVPFLAFAPVVALLSGLLIGEFPRLAQIMGVLLVSFGGLCLNPSRDTRRSFLVERWKSLRDNPGSLVMLLVATLWGVGLGLDKRGIQLSSPAVHGTVVTVGVLFVYFIWCFPQRATLYGDWKRGLGAAALLFPLVGGLAWFFQFEAIAVFPVAFFDAIKRATTVFAGLIVGRYYFGESVRLQQVCAALVMITGVGLILL